MTSRIARHHVHPLVMENAKALAGAFFEGDRSPVFRATFPNPRGDHGARQYVRANWPHFVKTAREILTHQLKMTGVPEEAKSAIYEALLEDNLHNTTAAPSTLH